MSDRELLKMALDALDIACRKYGDVGGAETDWGKWDAAMTALTARLAQPEQPDYSKAGFGKPQREWQGLTYEEEEHIVDECWDDPPLFIEMIEAKLKEKNT